MATLQNLIHDQINTLEEKVKIASFNYPLKGIKEEKGCYDNLATETTGNYLFNKKGLWHGGIHFSNSLTKVRATEGIRSIADGELVAYRVNDKYIVNKDEGNEEEGEGLYSNGFFLVKHKLEYPAGNILHLFSLYMHTANIDSYVKQETKTYIVKKGDTLGAIAKDHDTTVEKICKDNSITNKNKINVGQSLKIIKEKGIPFIVKEFETDSVKVLKEPIPVKAGDLLGLVGEYNLPKDKEQQLLHVEVLSGDDIKAFAKEAKSAYESDTSKDKPKPTQVVVKKDTQLYELADQHIVKTEDPNDSATIKKYDEDKAKCIKVVTQEPLKNSTQIEVDTATLGCSDTRYKLLKIEKDDVSSKNWSIYKNSIATIKVPKQTKNKQENDKVFKLNDIKTMSYEDKKYMFINDETLVLYSECQEVHALTFDWADIVDQSSSDDVTIFQSFKEFLFPKKMNELIEINPLYKKLFKLIDDNQDGKLQTQEIEDATQDKEIKQTTSKFIVKHSTEWDDQINMIDLIKPIIDEYKKRVHDHEGVTKHLDNEKKRIQNLIFFNECKKIEGFPDSDKVFHFNPIGLVGEFVGNSGCSEKENYKYEVDDNKFICFCKNKLNWLMTHEGYRKNPYVPQKDGSVIGDSGVTLGYGYDLGHQTISNAKNDLSKYYTHEDVEKLLKVVGKTKANAVIALNSINTIVISKDGAKEMLIDLLLIYAKKVYSVYPEIIKLHPYCQVSIVSLVYNRGNRLSGDRRKEMKNIQTHFKNGEFDKIPAELRAMKRLWINNSNAKGLLNRRDEEAELFEEGLNL